MKKIEATIADHQLDAIEEALGREEIHGITVSEVRGAPWHRDRIAHYRGVPYRVKFVPRVKIEVLVEDFQVPKVVAIIRMLAQSVGAGDDRILVIPVTNALRIHTGERGSAAS